MLNYILIFAAGNICMGAIVFFVSRSREKRRRDSESQSAVSLQDVSDFKDTARELAAAIRESANKIRFDGQEGLNQGGEGAAEKIESTLSENSRIANEIAHKTNSVSAIASKMEENVLSGFAVLEKNVKKIEGIKEKNSDVMAGIISLSNKVNKIRDIVRVINTITDQTKVIAFNAALEAASAGDTGKRFAVVSGEINRLAEDIAVLTRQIREQVEEIQSSSSSLIVSSEEGSDRIAEGHKLIKDLEEIFREIRTAAEITSTQTQTITVSTQQQLKFSAQIRDTVTEFSKRLRSCTDSADAAALCVGDLTKRAYELERFITAENKAGQGTHGD